MKEFLRLTISMILAIVIIVTVAFSLFLLSLSDLANA